MRVPKGSTLTISTDPFDGAPSDPLVTVVRANGTELTAPTGTVDHRSVLVTLDGGDHLDELDTLTVTVTATVDDGGTQVQVFEVDVIGSNWVTLGALRTEPRLNDEAKYPDLLLRAVRDEWEAWIEELCNRRMTPGYGIEHRRVRRGDRIKLAAFDVTALRLVRIDGVDTSLADFTLGADGLVVYDSTFTSDSVLEVHFEHGMTRPPSKLVREVRKAIARELSRRGANTPNDVIAETSTEGGPTIRYSTPDPEAGRYTGIMSLDPVIHQVRKTRPGFA